MECASCKFWFTSPRPETEELGKYYLSDDYISHSEKTKSIVDLIYKVSRVFTMRWKLSLIKTYSKSTSIKLLDYGCGSGDFIKACHDQNWVTAGVEPSPEARQQAIAKTTAPIHSDLNQLKDKYTSITLWHVLEHIPDLKQKLRTLASHLDTNGTMFIAVPNHESYDAFTLREFWAGYDVPRHLWHFTKKDITRLFAENNLTLQQIVPMKLDSYYVSILSNKHKRGRHSILGFANGIMLGLKSNIKARKTSNYSSLIYIASKK
jgi:2-polyprenyl-3-methyl-5-hydroxy-6-metoxy-1,4-benzoquinol methylase